VRDISDPPVTLTETELMRERAYAEAADNTPQGRAAREMAEFLKDQVANGKLTPKESIQEFIKALEVIYRR